MDFSNRIYKYADTSNVLNVGEVKMQNAHLYADGYEVFMGTLPSRKVVELEVRGFPNRELLLSEIGTVNAVLNRASGYIRNHQKESLAISKEVRHCENV